MLFWHILLCRGVLVTGGLGSEDQVLDSAEFFDLDKARSPYISLYISRLFVILSENINDIALQYRHNSQ
jgi:hypothetical protein